MNSITTLPRRLTYTAIRLFSAAGGAGDPVAILFRPANGRDVRVHQSQAEKRLVK